ncbi:MAG: hypothetical protein EBR09_15705 [Proteobacteria bacterium]|nr:hypothetical protein [Pseudomonadota bacterium]
MPAAQLEHAVRDGAPGTVPHFPTPHATQALAVLAPVSSRYVPIGQSAHADAGLCSDVLYLPAAHGTHALAEEPPVVAANVPALHQKQ